MHVPQVLRRAASMISAHCPDCERAGRPSLREITPTGERMGQSGSSQWWQLVMHSDGQGGICPGSGRRV